MEMKPRFVLGVGLGVLMALLVAAGVSLVPVSQPNLGPSNTSGEASYATSISTSTVQSLASTTQVPAGEAQTTATATATFAATETPSSSNSTAYVYLSQDAAMSASPYSINRLVSQPLQSGFILLPVIAAFLVGLLLYRATSRGIPEREEDSSTS
ncbi:MAG TPA: hypothetical protein VEJ36_07020 [Nitrososphaerales archaeon]|nr:hypothetical protein [Nitrososphaerales archaeon]